MGAAAALAVRPHPDRHPRERAPRPLPRHPDRAAHLAVVHHLLPSSPPLAGALYALLNNFADPSTLYYVISGDIVIMAVMGGMRSFWGPLLGAAVFVVLQDYHLVHDGELDELHRPGIRAGGAVLPARHPRLHAAGGPPHEPAGSPQREQVVRQPGRGENVSPQRRAWASCGRSSARTAPARRRSST